MAVCGRSGCAANRRIGRRCLTGWIEIKLPWIGHVKIRIVGVCDQRLLVRRQRSTQHWLVNQPDPEFWRMPARSLAHVVAELIFLLPAEHGERRDRRGELVI